MFYEDAMMINSLCCRYFTLSVLSGFIKPNPSSCHEKCCTAVKYYSPLSSGKGLTVNDTVNLR